MGSRFSAVFFAPEETDTQHLARALAEAVAGVEAEMSTFRPDSALMRLNAQPIGTWFAAPDALFSVIETALAVEEDTEGAFDIGVGDLVAAAGFGAHGRVPDAQRLAELSARKWVPTRQRLELDRNRRCIRKHSAVELDLSGIAKGFGVDRLAGTLAARGISSYLVSIDGEIRAGKGKPDANRDEVPWLVAVENPSFDRREVARRIGLEHVAIATSGDYRHTHVFGPRRVSHVMDPRARAPLDSSVASVTVIADACMIADAMASGLMVLGPHAGPQKAKELGVPALFMIRGADGHCHARAVGQNW